MTGGFLKGNQVHCRRKLLNKPFVVCGWAANSPSWLPGISKRVIFCKLLKGQRPQITQATHILIGRTLERAQTVKKKKKKKSACIAGDLCLTPGSGRSPGEGNGYPLQCSCLENPMDRSLTGYSPRGFKVSNTAEQHLLLERNSTSI